MKTAGGISGLMDEDEYEKPCGWFEPKVKHRDEIETDADRYEAFQEMWN